MTVSTEVCGRLANTTVLERCSPVKIQACHLLALWVWDSQLTALFYNEKVVSDDFLESF